LAKLAVKSLRKVFGELEAVKDVSFEVGEEETLCLLGPSGCGKTTTLRMIAGLETPTSGEVYIDGVLVNDVPPQERGIGLVFQDFAVFTHMSVFDNIAFGLQIRNVSKSDVKAKVDEIAQLLDLQNVLSKKAKGLSLSEIQRVAIGRSLAVDPKVLLLDEPLSNVDARTRERMRIELKEIQADIGITTVYVTHDQLEAMTLADRIAVMNEGLIDHLGTPNEIYERPKTLFVARFIGSPSMSFIQCRLIEKDGKATVEADGFSLDVSGLSQSLEGYAAGSELILGIRPEDSWLETKKSSAEAMRAEVQLIELLGSKSIYHLKIGKNPLLLKTYTVEDVEVKGKVWVTLDKNKLHLFDKKTGRAMT